METLEAQIKGGESDEQDLREDMRNLLTHGWLAPASARLSAVLLDVQATNDAAQTKQKDIQSARDRVDVLQKQIKGGSCPVCGQELPPPDAATEQALKDAEAELERMRSKAGDGPNLALERRVGTLIDTRTVSTYRDKQSQLNKILSTQYDRHRRLSAIKDRLKDNDAAAIRKLATEQDRLEIAIKSYTARLSAFANDEANFAKEQNRLAGILRRLGGGEPALAAEAYFFEYVSDLVVRTIDGYKERTRAQVE
ncbi:MAG: hypothetical protein V4755_09915, partial [Curtobacterium sp.]